MTELFTNISDEFKRRVEFIVNIAFKQENILKAIQMINDFSATCQSEEEKDFIDFYLQFRLMEFENESTTNLG